MKHEKTAMHETNAVHPPQTYRTITEYTSEMQKAMK